MNCGLGSVYQFLWCMVFGKIRAAQGFLSIMFDTYGGTTLLRSLTIALLTRKGQISWVVYSK